MPQVQPATIASPRKIEILPNAFYRPSELESLATYSTLRRAVKARKLKPSYAGKNLCFRGSDLLAWLSKGSK